MAMWANTGKCASFSKRARSTRGPNEETLFVQEIIMYVRLHTLAVSILANDLLQGMTDKHFPTSPRSYWACICCPVPFPIDLWGTDRENVRLQLPSTNSRPILSDLTFTPLLLINNKVITTVLISFLYFLHYQL